MVLGIPCFISSFPLDPLSTPSLLAAERGHVLRGFREEADGVSGRSAVAAGGEQQGFLHGEERHRLVPHVGAREVAMEELSLQGRAELSGAIAALPLQTHHLAHAEETSQ